jgi:hypothetical protein
MGVLVADQAQHHAIEEEVSVVLIAKRAGANYKNVWRLGARAERALVTGQHAEQSELGCVAQIGTVITFDQTPCSSHRPFDSRRDCFFACQVIYAVSRT